MEGILTCLIGVLALTHAVSSATITVCETTGPGTITCPAGQLIDITAVVYGRTNALPSSTCNPYNTAISSYTCDGSARAKTYVDKQCVGKGTCSLTNTYLILGDPCSGVPKFLKVDYICNLPNATTPSSTAVASQQTTSNSTIQQTRRLVVSTTAPSSANYTTTTLSPANNQKTICEMKSATFSCSGGKVLSITHVLWGRVPPAPANLCNPYNTPVVGANCRGGNAATLHVEGLCNYHGSCTVTNDWRNLGPDPCNGTPKYLQVTYTCVFPTTTSKTTQAMSPTSSTTTPTTSTATTTPTTTPSPTTTNKPTTMTPSTTPATTKQPTTTLKTTTLPPGVKSTLVCPTKSQRLSCTPGEEIMVNSVFFGRASSSLCNPSNKPQSNLNCHGGAKSNQTVHTYCDHQPACILYATRAFLGEDPCPGVDKYLQVLYHCVPLVPPTTTPTTTTSTSTTTTPTTTSTTTTPTTTSTTTTPTTTSTTTTPTTTSTTTTPTTTSTTTTPTTTSTTTTPTTTSTTPTTTSTTTTPTTTSTTTTPTTTSTTTTPTTTSTTTTTPTTTSTTTTKPTTTSTTTTTTTTTPTTTSTTTTRPTTTRTTTTPTTTVTTQPTTLPTTTFPPYKQFQPPVNAPPGADVCRENLVSGPHAVPDSHLTASSSWNSHLPNDNNGPARSRLYTSAYDYGNGTFYRGAWSAGTNDKNQYIQVEFNRPSLVRGVVTQGRHLDPLTLCCIQRTTEYRVMYSNDGHTWETVHDQTGNDALFKGNQDDDSLVSHMFDCPFIARFMRIVPVSWTNHISLRFDAIGCQAMTNDIGQCDPGWLEMPGTTRCYFFSGTTQNETWTDAEHKCQLQQGHLVDIKTVQEKNFILSELARRPTVSMWWVGLGNQPRTDAKNYKWQDGQALDTTVLPWKKGQPDNGGYGEHCGEFWNRELNDDHCTNKRNYICEKDKYWVPPLNKPSLRMTTVMTPPTRAPTTPTTTTPGTTTTARPPPTVFIPLPTKAGANVVSTNGNIFTTGCITSQADCNSRAIGNYQSCAGCSYFITCAVNGVWHMPCPAHLKWDDNVGSCQYRSSTCRGP